MADETKAPPGTGERQITQRVAVPVPSPLTGVCLPVETRWKPGVSANPGGRPKVNRTVSSALAELQDTEGETPEEIVEAFRARRGKRLCGADHKAIAIFKTELDAGGRTQISAVDTVLDRLEGKVEQPHAVRAQETEALIRQLAESTGISPEAIRALGLKLGGQG